MNLELSSVSQLTKPLSAFLHRYHVLIFVILVVGGLAFATYQLYDVIISSSSPTSTTTGSTFDQSTIDQIKQLRSPNDSPEPLKYPSGRTNPFQ